MIRLNRLLQIVAGSLVAGAIFACGDAATAPQAPEFGRGRVKPSAFTRCQVQRYDAKSRLIGVEGGSLKVGGHVLIVPPGALKAAALITMETPSGNLKRVVFGPEGLTFLRPVHLIMTYHGCTVPAGFDQEVVYVNESLSIIEPTPSESDQRRFKVDAKLTHFSAYVLSTYAVVY